MGREGAAAGPVTYPGLEALLAETPTPGGDERPHSAVEHVLATLAAYSYADKRTVSMIAARLGLEGSRCLRFSQDVDAMFIRSTAYLLLSKNGRVAILCYRGTEPTSLINWLGDVDVSPEVLALNGKRFTVHGGFYRNVRATELQVVDGLRRAMFGSGGPNSKVEALYVTGHSFGGAMAALMGALLTMDPQYQDIARANEARVFRGVYTFGQPMIGDRTLADECDKGALGGKVIRYIYREDLVPSLPPWLSGSFAHFGREFHFGRRWKDRGRKRRAQMWFGFWGIFIALVASYLSLFRWVRRIRLPYSMYHHVPQHYVKALSPGDR
jgi:hypothetical protein